MAIIFKQQSAVIVLSSSEHTTALGYDATNNTWTYYDINLFPPKVSDNLQTIVEAIVSADLTVVLSTTTITLGLTEEVSKPLTDALEKSRENYLKTLDASISQTADTTTGATLLFMACWHGLTDWVNVLLHNGANINQAINSGDTPLFIACQNGHTEVVKALLEKNPEITPFKATSQNWIRSSQAYDNNVIQRMQDFIGEKNPDEIIIYPDEIAAIMGHSDAVFTQIASRRAENDWNGFCCIC